MNGRRKEPLEPSNKKKRNEEVQNTCIFKDPISPKESKIYERNKKTRNNTDEIKTTNEISDNDYFSFKLGEENTIQDNSSNSECSIGTVDTDSAEMEKFNPTDLEVVSVNESGEFITEKQINKSNSEVINKLNSEVINNDKLNEETINNEGVNEKVSNLPELIKNIKVDKQLLNEKSNEINMSGEKKTDIHVEKENTNKPHEVETPNLPFYNTYLREPIFHEEEKEDGTSLFKNSSKSKKWSKRAKKIIAFVLMGAGAALCIAIVIYKILVKENNEKK